MLSAIAAMKQILILLCLFLSFGVLGQPKAKGIINDPDGYTNIRSGKGSNFEIVGKIYENELFVYYDSAGQNWLKVAITKCRCDEPNRIYNDITGYVHRSRILNTDDLTQEHQKQLLLAIFREEKRLYELVINTKDRTTKEYRAMSGEMNVFHDYQFDAVLGIFDSYMCQFKDRELLEEYLNLLEVETGSADEMPSYSLGTIFQCHPEWMFESMKKHLDLMNLLEWGIVNIGFSANRNEPSELERKYNELRVSIGLEKTDFSLYYE